MNLSLLFGPHTSQKTPYLYLTSWPLSKILLTWTALFLTFLFPCLLLVSRLLSVTGLWTSVISLQFFSVSLTYFTVRPRGQHKRPWASGVLTRWTSLLPGCDSSCPLLTSVVQATGSFCDCLDSSSVILCFSHLWMISVVRFWYKGLMMTPILQGRKWKGLEGLKFNSSSVMLESRLINTKSIIFIVRETERRLVGKPLSLPP